MSNFQSKCIYCGSTSYGSGCIFSAARIHIHTDDPTRCIYCGMLAFGSGCIFNPYTKMHIHGADFGQTIKETLRKTVEISYLTDRLFENIKDSEAYKIKLINEKGNLLRAPVSPHEERLISPLSKLLLNLKKYIQVDSTTITESLKLLSQQAAYNTTIEEYELKLAFEHDMKHLLKQFLTLIHSNSTQLSIEDIESSIESSLLETLNQR